MRVLVFLVSITALTSQAQTDTTSPANMNRDTYCSFPSADSLGGKAERGPTANVILLNQSGQANQTTLQITDGQMNLIRVSQQDSRNALITTLAGGNNSLLIRQQGGDTCS